MIWSTRILRRTTGSGAVRPGLAWRLWRRRRHGGAVRTDAPAGVRRRHSVLAQEAGPSTASTASGQRRSCTLEPLWIQASRATYGLPFDECNRRRRRPRRRIWPAPVPRSPTSRRRWTRSRDRGARFRQGAGDDAAGSNDVLELYRQYPSQTELRTLVDQAERPRQAAGRSWPTWSASRATRSSSVDRARHGAVPDALSSGSAHAQRLMSKLPKELQQHHPREHAAGRSPGRHRLRGRRGAERDRSAEQLWLRERARRLVLESAPLPTCTTDTMIIQDLPNTSQDEGERIAVASLWADGTRPGPDVPGPHRLARALSRAQQPVLSTALQRAAAPSLRLHCTSASSAAARGVRIGWLIDRHQHVAPSAGAENVAGDACHVAQRAGLQMRAAGACARAPQRAVEAGDRQRGHQLGHHRRRPCVPQQRAPAGGTDRRVSRDSPEPLSITTPVGRLAEALGQPLPHDGPRAFPRAAAAAIAARG